MAGKIILEYVSTIMSKINLLNTNIDKFILCILK